MKLVIFPVWAHLVRNKSDEERAINDNNVEVEIFRGRHRAIMFERLARSVSIDGDLFRYCHEADRLQKEFDEDSEPVRVYVFEIGTGGRLIPVYAGRSKAYQSFDYIGRETEREPDDIQYQPPKARFLGRRNQHGR